MTMTHHDPLGATPGLGSEALAAARRLGLTGVRGAAGMPSAERGAGPGAKSRLLGRAFSDAQLLPAHLFAGKTG